MQTSANKLHCSWPAARGGGGKGVRVSRHAVLVPGAAGTVAACGRMEWMRKMWALESQAGVPEAKYLVNTDLS